jgi:hypothetical protein
MWKKRNATIYAEFYESQLLMQMERFEIKCTIARGYILDSTAELYTNFS